MKKQLLMLAFAMAAMTAPAQTVLWDGEDKELGSMGGFWDRCNPSVVENPEKDGINTSNKCLKFTMTGDGFGQKQVACPFRDWMTLDLKGNRRFSFMMKKAVSENALVELSDPTNGVDNYWQKAAAWYGGDGKWAKVVLDFSTNDGLNDFPGVMAITGQTTSVTAPQDVYIDNIVVEPVPMVGDKALTAVADNSLTGEVTVTGSLMKGDCQNANVDKWVKVEYDDFAILKEKLATTATKLDVRGVILKDAYWDQIQDKCPGITIVTDDAVITGITTVKSQKAAAEGEYFNLAGQRVAQPTKGLYIVNGKKIIK